MARLFYMSLLSLASVAPLHANTFNVLGVGLTKGNSNTNEGRSGAIQSQLDAAKALNAEADTLAQELDRLRANTQVPPSPLPPSKEQIKQSFESWKQRIPADADIEMLERVLGEERKAIATLKAGIEQTATAQANVVSQPTSRRVDISQLQQLVRDSSEPVTAEPGETAELTQARQVRRSAEHRRASLELTLRQEEQSTLEIRQRLLSAQLNAQRTELTERLSHVEWLNQNIAEYNNRLLELQSQELHRFASQIPQDQLVIKELAKQNSDLAGEILKNSVQLNRERDELSNDEYLRDQLVTIVNETRTRLRLGGNNASVGQWLWSQRMGLSSNNAIQSRYKATLPKIADLRLAIFNAGKARTTPDSTTPNDIKTKEENNNLSPEQALQRDSLRSQQANLTSQLQSFLLRRVGVLEQSGETLQVILRQSSDLRQVLDKELLWLPSHRPMDSIWLREWNSAQGSKHNLENVLSASPLRTARALLIDLLRTPWPYIISSAVVALLLVLRKYALRQMSKIAQQVMDFSKDRFGLSMAALGWSLLYTLPWSVAAITFGEIMQASPALDNSLGPLGSALKQLSAFIFVATLINAIFRSNGLALAHFQWPTEDVKTLRQVMRQCAWLIVPAVLLGGIAYYSPDDNAISTWGRLSTLVLSIGLVLVVCSYIRREAAKNRYQFRWDLIASVMLIFMLIGLTIGVILGYVYTAMELIQALLTSFVFLTASEVAIGLLQRWLLIGERRLALDRLRTASTHTKEITDNGSISAINYEADQLALVTVSQQTRRLLGLLEKALITLSLLYAALPILPALMRSESIGLWYTTNIGVDGLPQSSPVTLMDAILGILTLLLTISLARNLPGLLEIILSASARISRSTRYTTTTLVRYATTIIGTVIAFSLFGLRWGHLQWLAAALTVGLGFGLQEIFANFVSGLILLVERPFRVGDVISIEKINGTVMRIHTRATTVLDFDNKEIVIPNKTFITGQVTNWTLSNDVTRLVIDIGIAHGNDPAQVQNMLLDIAHTHPDVLDDPKPSCWFMALEGSGQRFELRAYVGNVDNRLQVRNDLNREINERLSAAGIGIAVPQMDIHMHDSPRGFMKHPCTASSDA
ncbi:mechanosensitive ion channel [Diaphorobacter aerolatus]|uniref:Mechanosensitive ion channel n=2 Tax=Diaphorobacter aerolatus TaxID=1288495 RepID=A0A7H0GQ22_9BURK|nr:mechanosensitive ion channel [Diaphorobacter aerolatus]